MIFNRKIQCLTALSCLYIATVFAQDSSSYSNICSDKPTCHDCIQTASCAWCFAPVFPGKRCFQPSIPTNFSCPEEFTFNPDNIQSTFLDKPLSQPKGAASGHFHGSYEGSYQESGSSSSSGGSSSWGQSEIVQVRPQKLHLYLRPHQVHTVSMFYTQAEDYPVDLYYLMDLSKSMEDDKEKLSLLGNLLAESMQNITSNFRLGFGSFVDKVVMPYVSTVPQKLKQPCQQCEAPYGYRNHMALSTNTSKFSQMVRAAAVSGNLDAPEGGFDAIMQAIVCNKEIGWRNQARRLLVFSTDAGFHYAGDGKLGGIVKPNDGKCHLDQTGLYTHSSIQDYPSISQINLKVKENAINVIFAVTSDQISVYEQLKSHIEGATSGQLSDDSSNIVELVKEQYQQISSSVEMKHEASSLIKVSYRSKCLDGGGPLKNTNKCGNIKVGDVINFQVDIEALSCPKDKKLWNQTVRIYPVGLGVNESLFIDVTLQCDCPCEDPSHYMYKVNSSECNYHGVFKCGICECDPSHIGANCNCTATDNVPTESHCRESKDSTVDCSGRGECVCGRCICNNRDNLKERIYGDFCECDNFSCDRHDGKLCSNHGECNCGKCTCEPGWTGDNCACVISTDTCIEPNGNGQVCSGHGDCVCGTCHCNSPYTGPYCNKCSTCTTRCDEFKDCVQCQMYKTGSLSEDECLTNCTHILTPISVPVVEANDDNNEYLCAYYDENECRFTFVYYWDVKQNKTAIRAQEKPECRPTVFLFGVVIGVIAAIVLLGLAILLLWKLFTTIHDRREFAKFEKERMMAKWDTGENPIYKQATSTFKNPTYAGKNM